MNIRPLPHPDPTTEPYWAHARDHEFWLPQCRSCLKHHFYPRAICPFCGSSEIGWNKVSGRGTVYSFTIVRRAPSPAFEAMVPYCVAIVALDEGPHLMSNIVDCDPEKVRIGQRVGVKYVDFENEEKTALPMFAPAES